jgi:signal transduction histidine kinase
LSWLFQPAEQHIGSASVDADSMTTAPAVAGTPAPGLTSVDIEAVRTRALQDVVVTSGWLSIMATDENGLITTFSVGAERMLGYAAGDVVDKATPADLCDRGELVARAAALSQEVGSSIPAGFAAMAYNASHGIEAVHELTCRRKDGTRLPVLVSVTSLRDPEKRILGYLLIAAVNTASKPSTARPALLDQRLRVQQYGARSLMPSARSSTRPRDARRGIAEADQLDDVALDRASRIRSDFLATMSHDLRTPWNTIPGCSEAPKDGLMGPPSGGQRECLGDISTSGQELLSSVNDILYLSTLEAGQTAVELEVVDLQELLADSVAAARGTIAGKDVELVPDVCGDLGRWLLDPYLTKRILQNLLSNAVQFGGARGGVALRARKVHRHCVGRLPVSWPVHRCVGPVSTVEDFLEVTVTDAGTGIAHGDLLKPVKTHRQVDGSLAGPFEVTGTGLAMVRRLAEVQGGAVAVASAVGEGTQLAVWLRLRATSDEDDLALSGGASARSERSCACPSS